MSNVISQTGKFFLSLVMSAAVVGGQQAATAATRAQLGSGKLAYDRYCLGCHGKNGDGKGPAAIFLNPKPRDFTVGKFKFSSVASGEQPTDEDLQRTIVHGLAGTSMPAWRLVPEEQREAIIAYIKTLSPRWEQQGPGNAIAIPEDPFKEDADSMRKGIARGEKAYYTLTTCWQCHPGYINAERMAVLLKGANKPFEGLRPNFDKAVLKEDGWGQMLKPTDFRTDRIKTGLDMKNLFRVIATGIGGTAMPTWKGSIPDEDIWAIAYYVRSLADERNAALRNLPLSPPASQQAAVAPAKPVETKPANAKPTSKYE